MYCKIINGRIVLPPKNDGNRINVHLDPAWLEAHGYRDMTGTEINAAKKEWKEAHPDKHDWQDKESFINAVYSLVPADKLALIMADGEALKSAVAGMALLTTDAAPDGKIDLADKRVSDFLALSGLTAAEVKAVMK